MGKSIYYSLKGKSNNFSLCRELVGVKTSLAQLRIPPWRIPVMSRTLAPGYGGKVNRFSG